MRKLTTTLLLIVALFCGAHGSALAAANREHGSCIGVGASSVEPGTKDDVALFINQLAEASGTTHGALVRTFAQQKGACVVLPPVPPHP
jgi:hypothetical protein